MRPQRPKPKAASPAAASPRELASDAGEVDHSLVTSGPTLSSRWKWVLSIVLALHVLAVFAEPFRFFTRSSQRDFSPDAGIVRDLLSPYIDFTYLHHGYFFFAPNPGPSHLIECRIQPPSAASETTSATKKEEWILVPDKKLHRPRLFYHRHFMLSEFLHNTFTPPEAPPGSDNDPILKLRWEEERAIYQNLQGSIVNHLQTRFETDRVEIRRIEHILPSYDQVFLQNWALNDTRLYVTLPESLPPPQWPPNNGEPPAGMNRGFAPWAPPALPPNDREPLP